MLRKHVNSVFCIYNGYVVADSRGGPFISSLQ